MCPFTELNSNNQTQETLFLSDTNTWRNMFCLYMCSLFHEVMICLASHTLLFHDNMLHHYHEHTVALSWTQPPFCKGVQRIKTGITKKKKKGISKLVQLRNVTRKLAWNQFPVTFWGQAKTFLFSHTFLLRIFTMFWFIFTISCYLYCRF